MSVSRPGCPNRPGLGHTNRKRHLKSLPSPTPTSCALFTNGSPRVADVLWLNWQGVRVNYTADGLKPRRGLKVTTYEGHPWIFRDHVSGDKLVFTIHTSSESKEVFFPIPNAEEGSPHQRPTQVSIHIPVYTLKERSLQVVRSLIKDKSDFANLEIPPTLRAELANPEDTVEW